MEANFTRGYATRERNVVAGKAIRRPPSSVCQGKHKIVLWVVWAKQRFRFFLAFAMFFERFDQRFGKRDGAI